MTSSLVALGWHFILKKEITNQPTHQFFAPRYVQPEARDRQIRQGDIPRYCDGRLRGCYEAHGGCRGHGTGWNGGFWGVHGISHSDQVKG